MSNCVTRLNRIQLEGLQVDHLRDRGDLMVDTKWTAIRLDSSVHTLNGWRSKGEGPKFVKVGRSVRYRVSDIEEWLASRTYQNTSEAKAEA